MIGELTQNLINNILTVPALGGRVGAAVGGTATDPTMAEAPVPFAWVIFGGDIPEEAVKGEKYQLVRYNFSVVVAISYGGTEEDLLTNQLKVLEDIQKAVRGIQGQENSDLWLYEGQELQQIYPTRLVYNMKFSIVGYIQV